MSCSTNIPIPLYTANPVLLLLTEPLKLRSSFSELLQASLILFPLLADSMFVKPLAFLELMCFSVNEILETILYYVQECYWIS